MEQLISVIVPVYKVEAYLDRCVESVSSQTYPNLEIILVDDGSPDRCPAMCDAWAAKDSRIRVIHKTNGGLSDARNAGMAAATGDFLGFVDSDDWIAPEMYEKLLDAMCRDGSDIAACAVTLAWEDGRQAFLAQPECCVLDRLQAQKALLEESRLKHPVWYKLYRREKAVHIPFEVGKYHEDVFWSYQAVGSADKVSIIDYPGYFYRQRIGSIMGAGYSMKRLDAVEAVCRRYKYFREDCPELADLALTAIWNTCIYHGQMALKYLKKEDASRVFAYLKSVLEQYPIRRENYAAIKITHRLWLDLAGISLGAVCRVKNFLKIGL